MQDIKKSPSNFHSLEKPLVQITDFQLFCELAAAKLYEHRNELPHIEEYFFNQSYKMAEWFQICQVQLYKIIFCL